MYISETKHIDLVWEVGDYGISRSNDVFNIKTGKRLKQTMVNSSIGYYLYGKFRTIKWIRNNCNKIICKKTPF